MVCKKCNTQVSKNYRNCPKCGYELRRDKRIILTIIGVVLVLALVIGGIFIGFNMGGKRHESPTSDKLNTQTAEKNPIPENATANACGENLTWRFDESAGTLYIDGEGDMWDFGYLDEKEHNYYREDTPWYSIRNNIKKVVIGDSVTTIGDWAFSHCSALESIEIPDSVTTIGEEAFAFCDSLASIEIPASVTTIGDDVFSFCASLKSIAVDSGNKNYCDVDGVLFSKDQKTIICYPAGKKNTEYVIPASVTTIGDTAFVACDSLASIEIPDSATTIGDWAFCACESLKSIEIPDSVTTIGEYAFYNCSALESIEIPDSVTTIGDDAFFLCTSLESIEIPDSVTTIGDEAFYYCESLETIHFTGTKSQWDALGLDSDDISYAKVTFGK